MRWRMYGHRSTVRDDEYLHLTPHVQQVRMYGSRDVVTVDVEEGVDGNHWGWLRSESEDRQGSTYPIMIQPHESLFRMQFPGPVETEVRRGAGRIVMLKVVEVEG